MDRTMRKLLDGREENRILPFLWMHGEEEAVLREYMKVIQESNIGAVCVESRPHPDFAGPGWWRDMDIILDEARKRGMKIWILDDSHFPTGYANGALETAEEGLCRQSLVYRVLQCGDGREIRICIDEYKEADDWKPNRNESYTMDMSKIRKYTDDAIIAVVAVKVGGSSMEDIIDLTEEIRDGQIRFQAPFGEWKVYICQLTRNRGPHRNYINMMNAASCRKLLEAVYEPHYAHYAADFGNTIAGFFSDEPELGNGHLYETGKRIHEFEDQAWSNEVQEELQRAWGKDFRKLLPLLWEQGFADEIKAKARYGYMDAVTRAVAGDFSMQIGNWCREHGVEYIGHLIEDNNQHTRTGSSLGHYFRGLSGQDMAGIDDIGGQVLPQGEWNGPYGLMGEERNGEFYHFVLGKLGSSLAAVDPLKKGRAMCEIFGNYGWEEGVRLEKYLVDHFLVRGINHFVPHAFSPKAFPDPDCPPHFYAHGNNPQYRHFGALMKYTNRICELMDGGIHKAPAAILYNAEADWTGISMPLEKPARLLAEHQIDYDFIPADVFADRERYRTGLDGGLKINSQEYRILIVPQMQFVTGAVWQALEELRKDGFPVCFLERYPEGLCEGIKISSDRWMKYKCVSLEELPAYLELLSIGTLSLEPPCPDIRYRNYHKENEYYLFVNEGTEPYKGCIHVPGQGSGYVYNAWENRLEKAACRKEKEGMLLTVCIEPGQSMVFVLDGSVDTGSLQEREADRIPGAVTDWSDSWYRSICSSKEYPSFSGGEIRNLPDELAEEKTEFSGFVRYEKKLACGEPAEPVWLTITDAYEGVEVFVNDSSLGIQIVPPFRYGLGKLLRAGENSIRIEVATTLERQMAKIPDPIRLYMGLGEKVPVCPSGINGKVFLERRGR